MQSTTLRRLRIADALAWPAGILGLLFKGGQHGGPVTSVIAMLVLVWAVQKLAHARELNGYRPLTGRVVLFNPFNPFSWLAMGIVKLVQRPEGQYRFVTLTVLKVLGFLAVLAAVQLGGAGL